MELHHTMQQLRKEQCKIQGLVALLSRRNQCFVQPPIFVNQDSARKKQLI